MITGNTPCYHSIHLLRPRAIYIMSPKSRLYMSHWNLLIKSSQCRSRRSGCITMNQNNIWLYLFQNITHTYQNTSCHIIQILSWFHNIQIIIRNDFKYMQYLIKHFAMLTGNTYDCLELLRIFLKFFHQRSHLYGFGTSPENQHNLLHAIRYLLFLVNSAKVKNYFPIIIWQRFKYRMSNQKNDDISLLIGFFIICKFKYVVFLHIRFHY